MGLIDRLLPRRVMSSVDLGPPGLVKDFGPWHQPRFGERIAERRLEKQMSLVSFLRYVLGFRPIAGFPVEFAWVLSEPPAVTASGSRLSGGR